MNDEDMDKIVPSRGMSEYGNFEYIEPNVQVQFPEDRKMYQTDTKCIICECNFNVLGLAHTIKDSCKFCYRGVCSRDLRFEYPHSETKSLEKMCSLCHNKIVAMSEEFENQIKNSRLEKIQLRQEIELATKQKEQFTEERKRCEIDLTNAQNNLSLSIYF